MLAWIYHSSSIPYLGTYYSVKYCTTDNNGCRAGLFPFQPQLHRQEPVPNTQYSYGKLPFRGLGSHCGGALQLLATQIISQQLLASLFLFSPFLFDMYMEEDRSLRIPVYSSYGNNTQCSIMRPQFAMYSLPTQVGTEVHSPEVLTICICTRAMNIRMYS